LGDLDAAQLAHSAQVAKEIEEELDKWNKVGIDPSVININVFILDQMVHACFDLLIEKEIFTRNELNYIYRKKLIEKLREIRKELEPQIARAKIAGSIDPQIFGPNGDLINLRKLFGGDSGNPS